MKANLSYDFSSKAGSKLLLLLLLAASSWGLFSCKGTALPPYQIVDFALGSSHACAVLDTGRIKCWGNNNPSKLGVPTEAGNTLIGDTPSETGNGLPFVEVGEGTVLQLVAGSSHNCILFKSLQVKCWGSNDSGQLGLGDTDARDDEDEMGENLPFVELGNRIVPVEIATGGSQATNCVIMSDATGNGGLKCWGDNSEGQLGLGEIGGNKAKIGDAVGEMGISLDFVDLGDGLQVVAVSLGGLHICAVLEKGEQHGVKCWGGNSEGQLGLGDINARGDEGFGTDIIEMGDSLPFVQLGTDMHIRDISAGNEHTCVLFSNGRMKCWGGNSKGQLGLGDNEDRGDEGGVDTATTEMHKNLPFVELGTQLRVTALAKGASANHSCALFENGQAKCWGDNDYGQLGLGDTDPRGDDDDEMGENLPFIGEGRDFSLEKISLGRKNTCGVSSVFVYCWGNSDTGMLANGCSTDPANNIGKSPGQMKALVPVNLGGPNSDRFGSYPCSD